MTDWPVWIIGAAAVVTAAGVLWSKVVRPFIRAFALAEQLLPVMRELADSFGGKPGALEVLNQIAAQFRTDSGSTLRDTVNRLEANSIEGKRAIEDAAVHAKANSLLAAEDRLALAAVRQLVDRLGLRADESARSNNRIEAAAAVVASDLSNSHARADETTGPTGAAADAASRSQP